jgi:hypothetical protein
MTTSSIISIISIVSKISKRGGAGLTALMLLMLCAALPALAQRGPSRDLGRDVVPAPAISDRAPIQDVIASFYVSRLQEELDLEDAQFVQMLPAIRDSLDRRNDLSQRLNRLRAAIDSGLREEAGDAELERLINEFDQTNQQLQDVGEELFRDMDPNLSARQRARLRVVQPTVEDRIRDFIERSRNAGPARGAR